MKQIVKLYCQQNGIEYTELTPYQLRLRKGFITCDIYPVNERYHIIKHTESEMIQKRGNIGVLNEFLESVFNYG